LVRAPALHFVGLFAPDHPERIPHLSDQELKQWITTQEAARITGYDKTYISRLIRKGRVKGIKPGHDWLVNRESLLAFHREMQARGTEKHNPHKKAGEE